MARGNTDSSTRWERRTIWTASWGVRKGIHERAGCRCVCDGEVGGILYSRDGEDVSSNTNSSTRWRRRMIWTASWGSSIEDNTNFWTSGFTFSFRCLNQTLKNVFYDNIIFPSQKTSVSKPFSGLYSCRIWGNRESKENRNGNVYYSFSAGC